MHAPVASIATPRQGQGHKLHGQHKGKVISYTDKANKILNKKYLIRKWPNDLCSREKKFKKKKLNFSELNFPRVFI